MFPPIRTQTIHKPLYIIEMTETPAKHCSFGNLKIAEYIDISAFEFYLVYNKTITPIHFCV